MIMGSEISSVSTMTMSVGSDRHHVRAIELGLLFTAAYQRSPTFMKFFRPEVALEWLAQANSQSLYSRQALVPAFQENLFGTSRIIR